MSSALGSNQSENQVPSGFRGWVSGWRPLRVVEHFGVLFLRPGLKLGVFCWLLLNVAVTTGLQPAPLVSSQRAHCRPVVTSNVFFFGEGGHFLGGKVRLFV